MSVRLKILNIRNYLINESENRPLVFIIKQATYDINDRY